METNTTLRRRPLPVVHINGYPGTGKLSVARHMVALFAERGISAKLVHNHLLIDPADAVLHRTQPGYQTIRQAIRRAIFDGLEKEAATYSTMYIFTDFQSEDAVGSSVCAEYAAMAKRRGCALISAVLNCEEEENLRRLVSKDRACTGKLTDVDLIKKFRKEGAPVHRFQDDFVSLELDVAKLPARKVADTMVAHCLKVCPDPTGIDRASEAQEAAVFPICT